MLTLFPSQVSQSEYGQTYTYSTYIHKLYLNTENNHQYKETIVIYKLLDSIKIQ
jgi:hypothetical protein